MVLALVALCVGVRFAAGAEADSARVVEDAEKYGIVVSATRSPHKETDIPMGTAVVRGETLRQRGARTLADALQSVVGMDVGDGSDNGSRLPNIGLWGLKEFDALLVSIDGVPAGGPFNPELAQIPIEDVDRIEILKGPQGTMYGVSAFAGMVQVYTRPSTGSGAEITERVGSFSGNEGDVRWHHTLANGSRLALSAAAERGDLWQDRTDFTRFRTTLGLAKPIGRGEAELNLFGLEDRQEWGSPLPYDAGEIVPGFAIDRNYAVGGSRFNHLLFGGTGTMRWPLDQDWRLEGTLGVSHYQQELVRSFVDVATIRADSVDTDGSRIEPDYTTAYLDLHGVRNAQLSGSHELVGGVAVTYGKVKAEIEEFDAAFVFTPVPIVPDVIGITPAEGGEVEDRRTLIGAYLHDSWTPHARVTVGAGGRFDLASEELEGESETSPTPTQDEREDSDWSGDVSLLARLIAPEAESGMVLNAYGNVRRNFKPAAPNITEPEGLEILEPERSTAWEVGLKFRGLDSHVSADASLFSMDFENQVVSILGPGGGPELVNAGETRYEGFEINASVSPKAVSGLTIDGGYAHHDPQFIDFTCVTPDSQFRDVSGNNPELAPEELWNVGASWHGWRGLTLFVSARGAGESFFNRRNTFVNDAWSEWGTGAALDVGSVRLSLAGRNLGDSRHVVAESEVGDSMFYVAAPRRVIASVTVRM